MKIYILGASGMLGRYVVSYFEKQGKSVVPLKRSDFEINEQFFQVDIVNLFTKVGISRDDVVVNCIGAIKPQVDKISKTLSILINSVFPNMLADYCAKKRVKLIHVTTDCVFSGTKGAYKENDPHDVTDLYGRSKSLGEPDNCCVVRTSIIGEEVEQARSLVEWVKSNKGKHINGFTNHFWNGVTCLQAAKVFESIIDKNLYWAGTRHVYSNSINKYELLFLINQIYQLDISITPKEAAICDRTLSSIYPSLFTVPNLDVQIQEMKDFYPILDA